MKKRRFKGILCLLTLVACLACTGCKIVVGNSVYLENGRGRDVTQQFKYNKKTGEFSYKVFSKDQNREIEGKLKKAATAPSSYLDEGYPYDALSKFPFEKLVDDTISVTERNLDAKMAFFLFMGIVASLESFDEQPNEVFYPIAGKIIMSDYVDYMDYDLDGSGEVTYIELFEGTIRATTELLK